jgi:hypothetical protein
MNEQDPASFMQLAAMASKMRELYQAYTAAGFTDAQAMQMICALLANVARSES